MHVVDEKYHEMCEELDSAKEYAEHYITNKAMNSPHAIKYSEMAQDELKHAKYLHEIFIEFIQKLDAFPQLIEEKYQPEHVTKKLVECSNYVKKILEM